MTSREEEKNAKSHHIAEIFIIYACFIGEIVVACVVVTVAALVYAEIQHFQVVFHYIFL